MKDLYKRAKLQLGIIRYMSVAYWKFLDEFNKGDWEPYVNPFENVPTNILETFLEKMDGNKCGSDSQLSFLKSASYEYFCRLQLKGS